MTSVDIDNTLRDLRAICDPRHVLVGAATEGYGWDALGPGRGYHDFERLDPSVVAVVRPGSTEEVAQIVQRAAEEGVPVIPFGGGSGLMGGAVSVRPSIVIDLFRLSRLIDFGAEDGLARVQAGAVLETVSTEFERRGFMFGHDPWTLPVATIGGAISTDSLGYMGAKYGSMGDQVLALTTVLPDGTVVETGAPGKVSVGPDLRRLFIAAEGCFGVITEAVIRAFPQPEARVLRAYCFPSFEHGSAAAQAMHSVGLVPTLLDMAEGGQSQSDAMPVRMNLGFHGFREEVVAQDLRARRICEENGGKDAGVREAQDFWEHRHDIARRFAERLRSARPGTAPSAAFDFIHVTLRRSRVLDFRRACLEIAVRHEVTVREFGIWCWPELFSAVLVPVDGGTAGRDALGKAIDEMLSLAQDWHGSMEYCHGVGLHLAHLMQRERADLSLLRALKRTLDQQNIMNPHKLSL